MKDSLRFALATLMAALASPVGAHGAASAAGVVAADRPATLSVGPWVLHGDLVIAPGHGRRPAALLLNKAAGDRHAYVGLARELARRGVSSLRLDLRGHGESVNAGKFVPGAPDAADLLDGTPADVVAAIRFLQADGTVDGSRLAVVGASYSGEAMAEAARQAGDYARAYAALSPGSFSEESAQAIDRSGAKWLVTRSAREKSAAVRTAIDRVQAQSRTGEVWVLDGSTHATDVLAEVPGFEARLADWITAALR